MIPEPSEALSVSSSRLHRESLALAEERELIGNHLLMIDKLARKLDARGTALQFRTELIAFDGTLEEVCDVSDKIAPRMR